LAQACPALLDVCLDKEGSMPRGKMLFLLVALAVTLPLTIVADQDGRSRDDRDCRDTDHLEHSTKTPVRAAGVIEVPDDPVRPAGDHGLLSTDIGWVDPGTERFYLADRSNRGVDIFDAENDEIAFSYVGRVGGMAGPLPSGGGTAATNGPGPNGVLVT